MKAIAPAILYALFVWWFSTGLVLMIVLRRRAERLSLVGAAILFPVCLYVLARAGDMQTVAGAYAGFTAAIVLWGTQEVAFLTGAVTGPRPRPCPDGARGFDRFCYAISAILYHEVALVASGVAVFIVTQGAPNQIGVQTFLVLWVMRLCAKLNLFLGVPVLNDEVLPGRIAFIRSYFRRGPTNGFLPVAMGLSVLFTWNLVDAALAPTESPATTVGYMLVATLLGLAIIEHIFMLVPLPIDKIWRWSTRGIKRETESPPRRDVVSDLDRVLPTRT